jgi:hypothetical protein
MTEQYQYRVYCCTESNFVDAWLHDLPVTCPNNYKHIIDSTKIYKLDERFVGRRNTVYIQEEDTATQGNYHYECIPFNLNSNLNQSSLFNFKYPVNILSVKIRTSEIHRGDIINFQMVLKPPIGHLTSNVNIGDSNIYIDNNVLSTIKVGYHVTLSNNTIEDLNEVIIKNISSNLLTTSFASSNNYPIGTDVHLHVNSIKNLVITEPDWYVIGNRKMGTSYLPYGVALQMNYTNSNLQPKDVYLHTEYLY